MKEENIEKVINDNLIASYQANIQKFKSLKKVLPKTFTRLEELYKKHLEKIIAERNIEE